MSSTSTPVPPVTPAQNPWPGLFWYTEDQAHLFFGREAETQELLRLIGRETLTVLFGRSGLGKTSLLRAGVFPRLRLEGYFPVVLRLDYSPHAASPVEQVKALTEAAARGNGIDIESEHESPHTETLWEYFHRVHFWGPRNDRLAPVLVFDQFEETFTMGNRRREDSDIFEQLADLAENRIPAVVRERAEATGERQSVESGPPNYKIVVSLREDFVWRLDSLRPILPAILRNRFALGPLDATRGLEIIRSAGKQWVSDEVAQDIIDAVISSRRGEGVISAEEIEPAYLNVMCNELFERMVATGQTQITRELVAAEKGGILESLYERSLSGLDDSVREFVEEHLVTPAGFRATLPVEEARREHITDADLQKLVDRRLLRFEDRLGTQHVELAHDLLTGLVEQSRKRREQALLQHKLRQATLRAAVWAAVALVGIAGVVFYWLAYVHPSVTYYATFMRRNGAYELNGRLSESEITHRAESLKVTRRGFRGEMQAIEAINGYGHLIMDSQLDSSLFFPTNGMNGQFCRLEFTYDEKGQAVHEVALDMNARMVYALNYAPAQAEPLRNVRRGSVVAADGTTVISSFNIQYDPEGYVSEIRFTYLNQQFLKSENLWSASTNWTSMNFGATVIDQKNTKTGIAEQEFLDKNSDPIPQYKGFVGKTYTRDAQGELMQTVFHDAKGNPVPSSDGEPPIFRWQNDKWGNRIEMSYFDAAGKPIVWQSDGYQKAVETLDDHGSIKEEQYFGLDGKPVAESDTGCYGYVYERDQDGNGTAKGCLDAQGAPMNQLDTGYQKVAFLYDSSGRTIGNLYYDRDGKPAANGMTLGKDAFVKIFQNGDPAAHSDVALDVYQGCYGFLWGYDQNFNHTLSACLDASGKAYSLSAIHDLAEISHEVAFDFARSFALDRQLVALDPTAANRLDQEEAALTADQFDACVTEAASIKDSELSSPQLVIRDTILLACQYGGGKKSDARATSASLTGRLSLLAGQTWDFSGTRHYIQTSSHFRAASDAWDKLFASLQKGDSKGAADALNQLQPALKD